jgi:hypothetical protein
MSLDFDPKWYLLNNYDVFQSGIDPLEHYSLYGKAENRNPVIPSWFSEAIGKNGWVYQEIIDHNIFFSKNKNIETIRIINTPYLIPSHEIFLNILKRINKDGRSFYILLIRRKNKDRLIKKYFNLFYLDEINFQRLSTQVIGFIVNKKIIWNFKGLKLIRIKIPQNK